MKLRENHLDLSGITGYLNTTTDKLSDLQPLANTMKDALSSIGIKPPSELADLAQTFHDNIVAPVQGYTANPVANITSFVAKTITDLNQGKPQTPVQKTVAKGGQQVIQSLQTENTFSSLFSNPIFWVVVVGLIGLGIWLKYR